MGKARTTEYGASKQELIESGEGLVEDSDKGVVGFAHILGGGPHPEGRLTTIYDEVVLCSLRAANERDSRVGRRVEPNQTCWTGEAGSMSWEFDAIVAQLLLKIRHTCVDYAQYSVYYCCVATTVVALPYRAFCKKKVLI